MKDGFIIFSLNHRSMNDTDQKLSTQMFEAFLPDLNLKSYDVKSSKREH